MGRAPWAAVAAAALTSLGCQQLLPRAAEPWCRAALGLVDRAVDHATAKADPPACSEAVEELRTELQRAIEDLQEVCAAPQPERRAPSGVRGLLAKLAEQDTWLLELVAGVAPPLAFLVMRLRRALAAAMVVKRRTPLRAVRRLVG